MSHALKNLVTDNLFNGEIFLAFTNNHFAKNLFEAVTNESATALDGVLYMNLGKVGMIGQIIFEEAVSMEIESTNGDPMMLGLLVDLYIYYARSLYGRLLPYLSEERSENLSKSYSEFTKKMIEEDGYEELATPFRNFIKKHNSSFRVMRDLRDLLKEGNSVTHLYFSDQELFFQAKVFSEDKKERTTIDEKLIFFVISQSFYLWFLMTVIYMEMNEKDWEDFEK